MKRSPLKRNPAAIRDWVQASRKPLQRTKLKPIGPTGRAKLGEPVGPLLPGEWRREVWTRCEGRCIITNVPMPLDAHWWAAHHPLPKRFLAANIRYDPRNGVVVAESVHWRHESRMQVIPFEKLPESCMDFALEQGSWAVEALLRAHPRENT